MSKPVSSANSRAAEAGSASGRAEAGEPSKLDFEQALAELEEIVARMESGELSLEHAGPLAMLGGEALGHLHRFLVLNLGGETAATLGVGETLPFGGELRVGASQRGAHLLHRHLRVHHRFPHLTGQVPQVSGWGRRIEGGPQRIPQPLEHRPQLFRIVLAKNGESTATTSRELHLGQAGRRRSCSGIDIDNVNRVRHLAQRNS